MKLRDYTANEVHFFGLRKILYVLLETLFNLKPRLYVIVLVIWLVELIAFDAVKVLTHVKLLVVGSNPEKPCVVKNTTFLKHNSKDLIFVFIGEILTIIDHTWIYFVIFVMNRVRCMLLVVAYSTLKRRLLPSNNEV